MGRAVVVEGNSVVADSLSSSVVTKGEEVVIDVIFLLTVFMACVVITGTTVVVSVLSVPGVVVVVDFNLNSRRVIYLLGTVVVSLSEEAPPGNGLERAGGFRNISSQMDTIIQLFLINTN